MPRAPLPAGVRVQPVSRPGGTPSPPPARSGSRDERFDLELLRRYHDHHDLAARDLVTERCMPLVRSIAGKYRGRGEDLDDLVQVGALGLVKAVSRFDPAAGTRFVSYASPTIAGEIKRHFRDHTWAVHVPRPVQELALRVHAATREVLERTGREPTKDELAARLGVPVERIAEAGRGIRSYRTLSLDQPFGDGPPPPTAPAVDDPGYHGVEDRDLIDRASRGLDDRSRRMVDARWTEDLVQREIAERHGVSPVFVSRVLGRALAEMQQRVASGGGPVGPRATTS